jgi:hypothetical protein
LTFWLPPLIVDSNTCLTTFLSTPAPAIILGGFIATEWPIKLWFHSFHGHPVISYSWSLALSLTVTLRVLSAEMVLAPKSKFR